MELQNDISHTHPKCLLYLSRRKKGDSVFCQVKLCVYRVVYIKVMHCKFHFMLLLEATRNSSSFYALFPFHFEKFWTFPTKMIKTTEWMDEEGGSFVQNLYS